MMGNCSDAASGLFGVPVRMVLTRGYLRDVGYSSDGTPVTQELQYEQTDPSGLPLSLSSLCLGFVPAGDVVAAPHIAPPVVVQPAVAALARTHVNNVLGR
jgi:hypothetical protein